MGIWMRSLGPLVSIAIFAIVTIPVGAQAAEPSLYETMEFLGRHFRQHAHATLDAGCEQHPEIYPGGNADPDCTSHQCDSTISYIVSEGMTNVDFKCSANSQVFGGKIRFDPTLIETASCGDQTVEGNTKFIVLNVQTYKAGRIIFVDPGAPGETPGMAESAEIAAFSQMDQCERVVKAFGHLTKFKSDDPF